MVELAVRWSCLVVQWLHKFADVGRSAGTFLCCSLSCIFLYLSWLIRKKYTMVTGISCLHLNVGHAWMLAICGGVGQCLNVFKCQKVTTPQCWSFRGCGEPHLNVFKCKKITTYEVWFLGSWVPHLNVFSTKRSPYLNVGYSSMVIFLLLQIY